MKILITNDDGISAVGIRLLAEWAKTICGGNNEITVVAPKVEQSGMSHAIDFIHPVEIKQVPLTDGVRAYSMDSTPADCVRFGFFGLKEQYDLVLSGINHGVNLGADIVYSGTVGAIFEAARNNVPAIALSSFPNEEEEAAKYLSRVFAYVQEKQLLEDKLLFNVNIPSDPKGIKMTYQGSPYFSDRFIKTQGDIYEQEGEPIPDVCPNDPHRDTVAILQGYITVTPLLSTRTDMALFEKYKDE